MANPLPANMQPANMAPPVGQIPMYDPGMYQGLVSNLEDSMRMDNQAQQIALNRQMEGYGYGSGIYDYLINQVYGPILGVNFNPGDYSGYLQSTQGTGSQYKPGTLPDYYNPNAMNNLSDSQKKEFIPSNTGFIGNGYNQGANLDPGLKGTMTNGQYMNSAITPPSADYIAQMVNKYYGNGQNASGPINTSIPNPQAQAQASQFAPGARENSGAGNQGGQIMASQFTPGQGPSALGKAMPKGTYTQQGQSFNPNMNSTWAKFLAPTYGQVSKLGDDQLRQIQRQLPRGGQQDQAISDAISQKYGTLMGGWQGLVPQAMQGLATAGREMMFQQPSYTGGVSTMAGMRAGDQNAAMNEQSMLQQNNQFNQQLAQSKAQNKSGLFGLLGGALGAGVSALTGGLGGGLASMLSGGGKSGGGGSTPGPWASGYQFPS